MSDQAHPLDYLQVLGELGQSVGVLNFIFLLCHHPGSYLRDVIPDLLLGRPRAPAIRGGLSYQTSCFLGQSYGGVGVII